MSEQPRTNRLVLLPDHAVGAPPAVVEANEALRVASLAADEAHQQRVDDQTAAIAAPKRDVDAAIEALESGKEPTGSKHQTEAIEDLDRARAREKAAKEIAKRAARRLEVAILANQGPWLDALRADVTQHAEDALRALDEAQPALEALVLSKNVRDTIGKHVPREASRQFSDMTGRPLRAQRVMKALAEVRAAIGDMVPPAPPTPGDLAERERFQEAQAHYRGLARGGIVVSGG